MKYIIACSLLVCLFACGLNAQTYQLTTVRRFAAGDAYTMTASQTEEQRLTLMANSQPLMDSSSGNVVLLEADVRVGEVDGAGKEMKKTYTVKRCIRAAKSDTTTLIGTGKVIEASFATLEKQITLDGKTLDPDLLKALSDMITDEGGGLGNDLLLGLTKLRKVGEKWKIDVSALLKTLQFKNENIKINPRDVSAGGMLAEVADIGGVRCGRVDVIVPVKKIEVSSPQFILRKGDLRVVLSAYCPLDTNARIPRRSSSVDFNVSGVSKQNKQMTLRVMGRQATMINYSFGK